MTLFEDFNKCLRTKKQVEFKKVIRLGYTNRSQKCNMENHSTSDIIIISGNSHPELAESVANRLGVRKGGCSVYHKTNRETMVEIADSIRGKNIYIIQTGTKCQQ
ncbi:unnamed protein product [Leptidea sinapis]|uniref:Ribose-phosphate pyrophosphokinase N-terminal domain-containing protein n=1 Tax=Leptidea sinapis TaxID=189913 RepID=A0A5E4R231_9NEOP|nr:unnamed protein product [Leptidea sinapis]